MLNMKKPLVKVFLQLIIICSFVFNTGCWDMREINDSAVPNTIGVDLADDKKILFSALFVQPKSSGQSGNSQLQTIYTTSSDYSVSMAARKIMLSLSRIPDWVHVQTIVLGDDLVKNGLPLIIDFMNRNRNISPNTILLIAPQNQPESVLASVGSTGSGLKQLVISNEFQLGTYVPITMGDFTYVLMTPGIEAAVPQVIIEDIPASKTENPNGDKNMKKTDNMSKRIVLHGTAVFKGNKMLGSLNEYESRGYRWLISKRKVGGFLIVKSPLNPNEEVSLEIIDFSSKTSPRLIGNVVKMHIEIKVQLNFYEETGTGELLTPAMLKKLEQAANLEINRQINDCIHKSQNLNSDILGWGLNLQEHQPETWKRLESEWNDLYPLIEFDVKVKTTMLHSYLSKKSMQFR